VSAADFVLRPGLPVLLGCLSRDLLPAVRRIALESSCPQTPSTP
jgi:hypothetical protein